MSAVEYAELDRKIADWADDIDILHYVTHPEQRPAYDTDDRAAELQEAKDGLADAAADDATEQRLTGLYRKTLDRLEQFNRIIANRGDPAVVRDATEAVYGAPTPAYVEKAKDLLELLPAADELAGGEEPRDRDATDMDAAITDYLTTAGMDDWDTEYRHDISIEQVNQPKQELRIPHPDEDIAYSQTEIDAYSHHEAQHAQRGANGREQPYGIFGIGVGRYNATDEGLSTLLEFAASTPEHQFSRLRTFALRTLASDSVLNKDHTYDQTADTLAQYTDRDTANSVSGRAHRVGGFAKDHIYQQGLHEVARYLSDADDIDTAFETLYVGKFGMEDIDTVAALLADGELEPPIHTPLPVIQATGVQPRTTANVVAPLTR